MANKWQAQKTLLIVGEGYDERAFLKYLRPLLAPRGCGLTVTVKPAGGKTAKHIIEWTIRQVANVEYDNVAVMLDTDTDWSPEIAKLAKDNGITVLTSEPCFEALLLRIIGKPSNGDAASLKKVFAKYVNNDAMQSENYSKHFDKEKLIAARLKEPSIDSLLKLFGL